MNRLFATFRANTSLASKVMVFENLTNHEVRELLTDSYENCWKASY